MEKNKRGEIFINSDQSLSSYKSFDAIEWTVQVTISERCEDKLTFMVWHVSVTGEPFFLSQEIEGFFSLELRFHINLDRLSASEFICPLLVHEQRLYLQRNFYWIIPFLCNIAGEQRQVSRMT